MHLDRIHWVPGRVERSAAGKARPCAEAEAQEAWIFEGGFWQSWPNRLARAELLIWLDLPLALRLWRVAGRTWRGRGTTRPDLPEGRPEAFGAEFRAFLLFILRSRRSARRKMATLAAASPVPVVRLRSAREVRAFPDRTFEG